MRKLWAFQASFRTSAEITWIEFTTCTYNFRNLALESTMKLFENTEKIGPEIGFIGTAVSRVNGNVMRPRQRFQQTQFQACPMQIAK